MPTTDPRSPAAEWYAMGLPPGAAAADPTILRWRRRHAVVAVLLAALTAGCGDLIEIEPLRPVELPRTTRPTVVVDRDGERLAELVADGQGHPVTIHEIAPTVVDAVIAVEDVRFRSHNGIDIRALGRALARNIRDGQVVEGGSTITQQLAKNTATGPARTIERKVTEASIAWQIEQELSKDEILARYLNAVYFGNGAYGIEAAAREYFGIHAEELQLSQAALLAGMLRSPARYDPRRHPRAAGARRDLVLGLMHDQGRITAAEARTARAEPLGVTAPRRRLWRAAYFVDHVLDELQHHPDFAFLGAAPRLRAQRVFAGDLRIETTLDPTWQQAAEHALDATLSSANDPDGALVAIDPASGAVRALVGGRDYFGDGEVARFNLAADAKRQPGSTFKAIVLAAALRAGHSLDEVFAAPAQLQLPPVAGEPESWAVHNAGDRAFGDIDLRTATTWSVNVVYAQLIDQVGADTVADLARAMGVRSKLRPYRSLALGAQEVTVLDMASVQATLAAGGVYRPPFAISRITDGDTVLYEREPRHGRRVLDQRVALQVTAALRDVVRSGTGVRAHADRPLAGKTGTTQDGADAWFVGYTPDMAAATWIGFHEGRIPMEPPRTRARVEGGTWPAEAFARFTLQALETVPANDFTMRIPDLAALTVDDARVRLDRAGLDAEIVERYSPTLPPGLVLEQDPPPGRQVSIPPGYRVVVTVSSTTPDTITLPDLLDVEAEEAASRLGDIGMVPIIVRSCPGDAPTCTGALERGGRVWEQVPAGGATVRTGDRVVLHVFPDRS